MATPAPAGRRTQTERSSEMKRRLVDAAISSLVDNGYARTSAVEVCRRAGVTRGALNHHFTSLAALFVEALEQVYSRILGDTASREELSLEQFVRGAWQRVAHADFKAVIEIWLASRNDPHVGCELAPAIARMSVLFDPCRGRPGPARPREERELAAFSRLIQETLIGLALGRATSPGGAPVAHEGVVVDLLAAMARERDER